MEGCRAAAGWSEKSRMYYILIPPCHPGARGPHHTHLSSRGLTTGSRLWELSRSDTYRIHWIATVALLPRDDKEQITTTLSCHCERSEAIQSINLSQRDTYFLFNSVFAGANKFDYLDSGVKPRNDTEKNSADKNCTLHSVKTGANAPFFISNYLVFGHNLTACLHAYMST